MALVGALGERQLLRQSHRAPQGTHGRAGDHVHLVGPIDGDVLGPDAGAAGAPVAAGTDPDHGFRVDIHVVLGENANGFIDGAVGAAAHGRRVRVDDEGGVFQHVDVPVGGNADGGVLVAVCPEAGAVDVYVDVDFRHALDGHVAALAFPIAHADAVNRVR